MALSSASSPRLASASRCSSSVPRAAALRSSCLHQQPQRRSVAARVLDVTSEEQFEAEVLQSDVPVLVDFWAPWCGPCKLVAPLMTWAEQEHKGALKVVKIEHDKNKGLVEKYKVYGLPTFIVFKGGEEVEGSKSEGAIGKAALAQYIKTHAQITVNV